jgi:parallel beta-helix repeat protein
VIYNNIFQDSDIAIDVSESSTGNVIYGNTISQNIIGINVLDSGGNTIYCNSFINNGQQVNIFSQPNFWDNGYLGNYWSNYTGTDDDGDGIGDTPHVIDGNNRDNNPLMSPYEYWSNPTLGDVNLDAMVDDEDLFQLAAAYGSTPAKPNWNANCDLNKNYKIEVLDLSHLSKNYGSTP